MPATLHPLEGLPSLDWDWQPYLAGFCLPAALFANNS